jgi:diadenosine tetraphosphate (Ap4A) HIT family hydrolase
MGDVAGCSICEAHRDGGGREALYADDHVVASHAPVDLVRGYLGYLFVETRRHVPGLAARTDAEACAEAALVTRLARALEAAGAEHVYAFVFDHAPHHHVHVVARHPGTPRAFWGPTIDEWPDAPRGDAEATRAFCDRLRAALGR